jgi:hypothetical protein
MEKRSGYLWTTWIVYGILFLIVAGYLIQDYRISQVVGTQNRFSLAMSGDSGDVSFVSFDPVERRVFALPFPKELSIKSRSVGEYSIGSLYKLGQYDDQGGEFVRRKVQGFMRVPIPGYLVVKSRSSSESALKLGLWRALLSGSETSNLSKLDILTLLHETGRFTWKEATPDELARAGVLETKDSGGYLYRSDRLQQYVGTRLFDWGIGAEGVTIAVINMSGVDGLGSDMADFMNNLGFDVVSVRTGTEVREHSRVLVGEAEKYLSTTQILQKLLAFSEPEVSDVSNYRSEIVVEVGTDAQELF